MSATWLGELLRGQGQRDKLVAVAELLPHLADRPLGAGDEDAPAGSQALPDEGCEPGSGDLALSLGDHGDGALGAEQLERPVEREPVRPDRGPPLGLPEPEDAAKSSSAKGRMAAVIAGFNHSAEVRPWSGDDRYCCEHDHRCRQAQSRRPS